MAGLVGYGSSDEDDVVEENAAELKAVQSPSSQPLNGNTQDAHSDCGASNTNLEVKDDAPLVGPVLAPSHLLEEPFDGEQGDRTPQSPYSASQALLRDLTMPTMPNYDIPPSPPGSPSEGTTARFKHFLELKKGEIHFNEKLLRAPTVKNPALMEKLMDFSEIDEASQYSTTLPKELWNPSIFPEYAYKEELAKSQQKTLKRKEDEKSRGQRESVEFVPATTSAESLGRGGTPSAAGRAGQKSAAERVMAGLDKGRASPAQMQGGLKRKSRFDN